MYRFWDMECDGQIFLSLWTDFDPLTPTSPPNNQENTKFWKNEKNTWDMECNREKFLSFWTIFCPFTPLTTWKNKIFKKWKKEQGDIIILQICTKNHDHMLQCSWDMAHDGCSYFTFWAIFCPFTTLTTQKIKIFKKWKKLPGDIIILRMCTKNYDHMMYISWDMVRNKWMVRWMNRQKKWYTEVGALHKK